MNLDDYATQELAKEILKITRCGVLNSEGKYQSHDFSDPYPRWGWRRWRPVRRWYRRCVRCDFTSRLLRLS